MLAKNTYTHNHVKTQDNPIHHIIFGKLEGTFRIYQSRKNIRKVVMLEEKERRDRELHIPRIVFDIHYSERLSIGKESLID